MIPINDKLSLVPNSIICKVKYFFENKFQDFDCEQDEIKKKYYIQCFNIIKKDLLILLKETSTWKYSMNTKYCDHINKYGNICNKQIEIIIDKETFKCAKHVSKKYYKSNKKENIDKSLLCNGINNKGHPCKNYKNYGNYCYSHYNKINFEIYNIEEEINIFNNIHLHNDNYDNHRNKLDNLVKENNFDMISKNGHQVQNSYNANKIKFNNEDLSFKVISSNVNKLLQKQRLDVYAKVSLFKTNKNIFNLYKRVNNINHKIDKNNKAFEISLYVYNNSKNKKEYFYKTFILRIIEEIKYIYLIKYKFNCNKIFVVQMLCTLIFFYVLLFSQTVNTQHSVVTLLFL